MCVITAQEHDIRPEPIARREGVYDRSEGIMTQPQPTSTILFLTVLLCCVSC